MTVINAMKFNDREGAIVADEQSSGGVRKYDLAEKDVLQSFEEIIKEV